MDYSQTLTLDLDEWDLTLDAGGNIAVSTGAYAVAQNVANAARLFTNDAWYARDKGIPHFALELGRQKKIGVLRSRLIKAAKAVEGVEKATVTGLKITDRKLTGNISLILTNGRQADVAF